MWALDEEQAPGDWFPRDCPRSWCWTGDGRWRMHAIESKWLHRMMDCRLYAYQLDPAPFRLQNPSAGYWVATEETRVISLNPAGDLLLRHADAGIELRIVRNLWPLIDAIAGSGLEFSIIRKANATPRSDAAAS